MCPPVATQPLNPYDTHVNERKNLMNLPETIDSTTHPYLIKILRAYEPHTQIPARIDMLQAQYDTEGHFNMKDIAEELNTL